MKDEGLVKRLRAEIAYCERNEMPTSALNDATDAIEAQQAEIERLRFSESFYKRRCDAMQDWQSRMRDPERTVVCDILANGFTLTPEGSRYTVPVDPDVERLRADAERYRWLRRTTNFATSHGERVDVRDNPTLWDSAIDSAINKEVDAAREALEKP